MSPQPGDLPKGPEPPALGSHEQDASQLREAAPVTTVTDVTITTSVQDGGEKNGCSVPDGVDEDNIYNFTMTKEGKEEHVTAYADDKTGRILNVATSEEIPADALLPSDKKRKNKGGKSMEKRGETSLNAYRGTGFEEYYCDPPMTANEKWDELNNIYQEARSFEDRIEDAIQRFRARRRMDSERRDYFDKYLRMGGIDTSVRQFQGAANVLKGKKIQKTDADDDDDSGSDVDDIVREAAQQFSQEQKNHQEKDHRIHAAADTVISHDPRLTKFYTPGADGWVVGDFEGVAAGFLSSKYMKDLSAKSGAQERCIDTIINFLKYVYQQDVCPEYKESVTKAWQVCEQAKSELPLCLAIICEGIGELNSAARILFCTDQIPHDATIDLADPQVSYCDKDLKYWEFDDPFIVPKGFNPALVFKSVVQHTLQNTIPLDLADKAYSIKQTYHLDVEIVDIEHPALETEPQMHDTDPRAKPVGKAFVRPCVVEDGQDNSLSRIDGGNLLEHILFEENILRLLVVGMKLQLVVCELECGFQFVKQIFDVLPSFYTFLPQELMLDYKEPELSLRPGPSEDDPEVEARALELQAKDDAKE